MGYYINPEDCSKEEWLIVNAQRLANPQGFDFSGNKLPVVLVNNGPFTAAGIAYDKRELDAFLYPDHRKKIWYEVEKEKLKPWYKE